METCFAHSEQILDVPRLRRMWAVLRELPRSAASEVMTHGDLIPAMCSSATGGLMGQRTLQRILADTASGR